MEKIKAFYGAHKNSVLIALGVCIIAVILLIVWLLRSPQQAQPVVNTPSVSVPVVAQPKPVVHKVTSKQIETPKMSYTDAVKAYADRRIQFDQICRATPFNNVYKNGTEIMIDNRGPQTRIFNIASTAYTVSGYDYAIVKLSNSTNVSQQILIDCGAQENAATVLIER